MRNVAIRWFSPVLCIISPLFSDLPDSTSNSINLSSSSSQKHAKVIQLTPLFELPLRGRLPLFYFEKYQYCSVDSMIVDSAGDTWILITDGNKKGWTISGNVQMVSSNDNDSTLFNHPINVTDAEKKRRLHSVLQHKDWSRRIQKIVKDGKICLEMTSEQLIASWGEPLQTDTAFLFGFGKHEVWFYKGNDGRYLVVNISEGKVIGWSL